MFDLSFAELALIAVVALLVLGPERLPGVARTAGALLRRMRNSWQGVRSEIERELAAEDIKRSIRDTTQGMDIRGDIESAGEQIRKAASGATSKPSDDEPH
jgi:sec-independent protein translocase protein TatB